MPPRPLARLHDVPAVVYRVRRRHLHKHVFARVHRIERDARVKIRRHRNIDNINVRIVASALPAFGAA